MSLIFPRLSPPKIGSANARLCSKATWTNGEIDQDELAARASFASMLHAANEPALAEVEFGKILALDPDHIDARMMRAMQSIEAGRLDEAFPDLEVILNHPGLVEHLRKEPMLLARMQGPTKSLISHLHDVSRRYCLRGKFDKGRTIARRVLDVAILLKRHVRRIALQPGKGLRPLGPARSRILSGRPPNSST